MNDRAVRKAPSRAVYALQIGDTCYTTGSYRHVCDAFDAIQAYVAAVKAAGTEVPLVVQLLM